MKKTFLMILSGIFMLFSTVNTVTFCIVTDTSSNILVIIFHLCIIISTLFLSIFFLEHRNC